MKILLPVPGFYTPNSDLWERHFQNLVHVNNLSTVLSQIIPNLWESPNSGHKGKICCSAGHLMGSKCYVNCS